MPTRFQLHVTGWKDCKRCPLHPGRAEVCLYRGSLPADVVFVGQAPGRNEDVLGKPFVGPAGQLLDTIIERSVPESIRKGFTNLVGCFPNDDGVEREPELEEIMTCAPRLVEIVEMANPKLVVCVGKQAQSWLMTPMAKNITFRNRPYLVGMLHPGAILKSVNPAGRGIVIQREVLRLRESVQRYLLPLS